MKRRLLPLALIVASGIIYACSSDSDDGPPAPDTTPEGGSAPDTSTNDPDTSTPDTSTADVFVPPTGNPIEGVAAPVAVAILNDVYTEGPQWFGDGLYFTEAKPDGHLVKLTLPNTTAEVRSVVTAGSIPLGTTLNEKTGKLLTIEVNNGTSGAQLVETPTAGTLPRVGVPLVLVADSGTVAFDSPNDLVVRKSDGTIYLTDPSYQAEPGGAVTTNHLWRVKPTTNEVFETKIEGRPNGIALSPNDSILYVSFTDPAGNPAPPPPVMKYTVAADGSLGAAAKFVDIAPGGGQGVNSLADGIAVDVSGNVYVAVRSGVDVFKPDGAKWGHIPSAKVINGLAFGGADKKTLFMTSDKGLFTVTVKIAGLAQ